jgi:DNA processing protein
MTEDERLYQIGMTMINGVGGVIARQLIGAFGSAEAVFKENQRTLEKLPGIGKTISSEIKSVDVMRKAEKEYNFVIKNGIDTYFYTDESYPHRLRECQDAPLILYFKGKTDLNPQRCVSIVGTRNSTDYGHSLIMELLSEVSKVIPNLLVISGLAYGIDIRAHREALRNSLPTAAVLAHGLDRIYPHVHRQTAVDMLKDGGLLTDFPSGTNPDRPNFIRRNRIVAGLSDATIVVESAAKGGSLITADIAFSYSRDVFAYPGRVTDQYSAGCNRIIKENKAGLITCAADFIKAMGWEVSENKKPIQQTIVFDDDLDEAERAIISIMQSEPEVHVNQLARDSGCSVQDISVKMFELEMKGLIRSLPGNKYKLN